MGQSLRDLLDENKRWNESTRPSHWLKRLANLLIDTFFFYILILALGFTAALINPTFIDILEQSNPLVDQAVGSLLFVSYYVVFESWLGQTPGKMITKTKVVNQRGEQPTFWAIMGRNFVRLIPFDFLTFLRKTPVGFHDRVTQTFVIDDRPRTPFERSLGDEAP